MDLADSAQVPRVKAKSTEAIAEVDLDLDEGDFETNTMGYMMINNTNTKIIQ